MKKISLYISMLLCLWCMLPLTSQAQINILKNPSFEFSTSNFSNAVYNNKVNNWILGYSPSGQWSPYDRGGTPEYMYYSGISNCGFGSPPNILVDPSYYPTYPVTGQKFIYLGGKQYSNGESIIGEFDMPLCEQTYTVSLWAMASNSVLTSLGSCTAWDNLTTFGDNKIEVVLRKTNNYTLEKVIYTTPTLDYTQWQHYTQAVTITAADIAAGYDRIEFRHLHVSASYIPPTESLGAFIDEVGFLAPVSGSTRNISVNCGDTIDLDTIGPVCSDSSSWMLLNQTLVNPTKVSPGSNTTYIRKCFNAGGCLESIDTVNVEVKTGTFNNTTRSIACGDTIDLDTLSSTSCFTTEWYQVGQGIIGSTVVSPGSTTQYVKVCYSESGCIKAIDTITININPPSTNTINRTLLCTDTLDLDTLATYYEPCDNVVWELQGAGPLSSTIISPGTDGTYTRTCYSATGCIKNITTVNITIGTKVLEDIDIEMTCGETIIAFALNGYNSYSWSPGGETTQTKIIDDQGTYTVTMTTADGCNVTQSYVVTRTDLDPIVIDYYICQPTDFTPTSCNNTSPVQSWDWTIPGGVPPFSMPGSSDGSITFTNTGTYELTVQYTNGCSCTYIINVHPIYTVSLSQDIDVCYGDPVTLDAFFDPIDPNHTIMWDGIVSNDLSKTYINNTSDFTVVAELYDENGCLLISKTFNINVPDVALSGVQTIGPCPHCRTIPTLNCPNGYWEDDPSIIGSRTICATDLNPTESLTYICVDNNGCIIAKQTERVTAAPTNIQQTIPIEKCFGELTTLDIGEHIELQPGYTYVWDVTPDNQPIYTFTASGSTSIFVKVYDDDGCLVADIKYLVTVVMCKKGSTTSTSIIDQTNTSINIYPNPSTGVFTLELTGYNLGNTSYTIVDAVGREIMKAGNIANAKSIIDLSNYEKGIYFIRIQEGEAITTKKIIIQ